MWFLGAPVMISFILGVTFQGHKTIGQYYGYDNPTDGLGEVYPAWSNSLGGWFDNLIFDKQNWFSPAHVFLPRCVHCLLPSVQFGNDPWPKLVSRWWFQSCEYESARFAIISPLKLHGSYSIYFRICLFTKNKQSWSVSEWSLRRCRWTAIAISTFFDLFNKHNY